MIRVGEGQNTGGSSGAVVGLVRKVTHTMHVVEGTKYLGNKLLRQRRLAYVYTRYGKPHNMMQDPGFGEYTRLGTAYSLHVTWVSMVWGLTPSCEVFFVLFDS